MVSDEGNVWMRLTHPILYTWNLPEGLLSLVEHGVESLETDEIVKCNIKYMASVACIHLIKADFIQQDQSRQRCFRFPVTYPAFNYS